MAEDVVSRIQDLNERSSQLHDQGRYAPALQLALQAHGLARQHLQESHPNYATSLNNLARLYQAMGNYPAAEPLLQEALEIRARALGKDHPNYATSLNNLAGLYHDMGNYPAAEPLYQEAREIRARVLGKDHPDYATSLNNLARLYHAMGNYPAAEPLLQEAREIRARVLGKDHPDYANSLTNLALLYAAADRQTEAMALLGQATTIEDRLIGQVFAIGSENQRLAYLATFQGKFYAMLSLVSQRFPRSDEAARSTLDLILRRKAIGAEALAAQRDAVLGGRYPALAPRLRELTALRERIAQKTLAGAGQEGIEAHRQTLAEWTAERVAAEAELARRIPEMNLEKRLQSADRQAIAAALPPRTVLVEFVRFTPYSFAAVPARGEVRWKPARYLAFTLSSNEPDDVAMIDLGEAESIDSAVAAFRGAIAAETDGRSVGRPSDGPRQPRSTGRSTEWRAHGARLFRPREPRGLSDAGRGAMEPQRVEGLASAGRDAGDELRALVFDPLVDALGGHVRLLLAPDGDLSRLPFEVLPLANGRRLIDEYRISYLTVGRDVLRFGTKPTHAPAPWLVVAAPDFDLGGIGGTGTGKVTVPGGRRSRDVEQGSLHFPPLPGTKVEGQRIAGMLGAKPWLDTGAVEARVKAVRSPRTLHLATHGFFLADQAQDPNVASRGFGFFGDPTRSDVDRLRGPRLENPLLRSGLALAGANTWLKRGILPLEAEDGLLTAEDVTGMDLLDTELVVLSACETGLGEVRTGEGVFGLRRAFALAGAKTLVMSLWKVPDLATAILMTRFYENLLQKKMRRAEALRAAQLYVREVTVGEIRDQWLSRPMIQQLAGDDKIARWELEEMARKSDDDRPFVLPLYWGAFICEGEPDGVL